MKPNSPRVKSNRKKIESVLKEHTKLSIFFNKVRGLKEVETPKGYRYKNSTIVIAPALVERPEYFAPHFSKGDKLVDIHLITTSPKDVVILIKEIEEGSRYLREAGFAGIIFITPNPILLEYARKRFQTTELKTPFKAKALGKAIYLWHRFSEKHRFSHAFKPTKTLVIKL